MSSLLVGKRSLLVISLAILLGLVLAACGDATGLQVGDPAPDFAMQSVDGNHVSLVDFSGKPVLLYFHMAMG